MMRLRKLKDKVKKYNEPMIDDFVEDFERDSSEGVESPSGMYICHVYY